MLTKKRFKCRAFLTSCKGSVTLETTLIFPIILLCILLLIFILIYHFYSIMVLNESIVLAERVAFNWNNTHKDHKTGEFDQRDHLYWHLHAFATPHKSMSFTSYGSELDKESRINELLHQAYYHYHYYDAGMMSYNQNLVPKLEVSLSTPLPLNYFDTALNRGSTTYLIHPSSFLYDYQFFQYIIDNTVPEELQQKLKEKILDP